MSNDPSKEKESQLVQRDRQSETLLNALPEAVVIINTPDMLIEYANNKAIELFGFLPNELLNQKMRLLCPTVEEYLSFAKQAQEGLSQNKDEIKFELFLKNKSTDSFLSEVSVRIIKEDNGNIKLLCLIRDISRQQNETDLLKSENSKLITKLESRTKKFTQMVDQLQHKIMEYEHAQTRLKKSIIDSSELRYALYVSTIISIADIRGKIIYVNNNLCELAQYSNQELVGNDHRVINSGYHSKEFFKELWDTIKSGKVWKGEIKNKTKSGIYFWLFTIIIPFRSSDNTIYQYFSISKDITERKSAEEALVKSEQSLSEAQKLAHVGSWEWDLINNKHYWSDEMYRILKLRYNIKPSHEAFLKAIHPADFDFVKKALNKAIENKTNLNIDHRIIQSNGRVRRVHSIAKVKYDKDSNPQKIIGIFHDFTEIERYQNALLNTYGYLEMVMENALGGIFTLDKEVQFGLINKQLCELTGYKREELIGQNFSKIFHPKVYKNIHKRSGKVLNKGEAISNYETELISKTGKNITIILSLAPILYENKIENMVGTINDISDRKKAEKELLIAKEFAESANIAKSEFISNMSHEIRTPMNAIMGMTELVLLSEIDSEQKEYLEIVKSSSSILLGILNDILDYSQIEANKMEIINRSFPFRKFLNEFLNGQLEIVKENNLALRWLIEDDIPDALIGDANQLRNILTQLINNAVKFTENGKINILMRLNEEGSHNNLGAEKDLSIHFTIKDTGIGIEKERQNIIFDPFRQIDGSSTRKYGGTGLGLAIAKSLVELMCGKLWVESEIGKGCVFHFTASFDIDKEENHR